jgi:hypothetical protein
VYICPKGRRVEEVGGEARSVSWADVAVRKRRAPVEETEMISMGSVQPEMGAETSTEEIEREAGVPEVKVGIQETDGMVI